MQYQFRDSEFLGADDKRKVLKAWVRFLKGGLCFAYFTKRLYEHLHLHCSFIAHYSRLGFYQAYFERGETIAQFLSQFDRRGDCRSVEYGGAGWMQGTYADINRAMVEEGAGYIPALVEKAQAAQRDSDVAAATQLLAKHGIHLN